MPDVKTWRWRIRWAGKWATAPGQWTEEEIRREHPEAERIEGSLAVRHEPDSPAVANRLPADSMDPRIESAWSIRRKPGYDHY